MPPRRRYIKLFPEITEHPVFGNPAALQVFIYLLTRADWQTGIVTTPVRQITRDCGRDENTSSNLHKILRQLEAMGSIEITSRKPFQIHITNWKKWQANEPTPRVMENTPRVMENTPPYPRARYKNSRIEEYKEVKIGIESNERTNENNQPIFTPPNFAPHGYPTTPEEVITEATRQGLIMTTAQAVEFLNYYEGYDWTIKGSRIFNWQCRIRKWLDVDKEKQKAQQSQRAAAINPNAIGSNGQFRAGYRIAGVEPPTEDFQ